MVQTLQHEIDTGQPNKRRMFPYGVVPSTYSFLSISPELLNLSFFHLLTHTLFKALLFINVEKWQLAWRSFRPIYGFHFI